MQKHRSGFRAVPFLLNGSPGLVLGRGQIRSAVFGHLQFSQGVAPDFGFIEVQQTRLFEIAEVGIIGAGFGIDPGKIKREGLPGEQVDHLFAPFLGLTGLAVSACGELGDALNVDGESRCSQRFDGNPRWG